MKQFDDDTAEINRLLEEQLEGVLNRFYPGWVYGRDKRSAFPEPKGDGDLGSFQVYLAAADGKQRGDWFRRSQRIGGRPIQLVSYAVTGDHKAYREGFAAAREFLGKVVRVISEEDRAKAAKKKETATRAAEARRRRIAKEEEEKRAFRAETAKDVWKHSSKIGGTPAEQYLRDRGIAFPIDFPSLRYAKLIYPFRSVDTEPQILDALICAVVDSDLQLSAVWRIFLQEKDGKVVKAGVPNPKLGLGPAAGCAVWIGTTGGTTVNICEGVETALGIWGLTHGQNPVGAALSTSGMINFRPPKMVDRVIIWPDGDRDRLKFVAGRKTIVGSPGIKAANELANRLKEEGLTAIIQPTQKNGRDFLDIWNGTPKEES